MHSPTKRLVTLLALAFATLGGLTDARADSENDSSTASQENGRAELTPRMLYLILLGDVATQRGEYVDAVKAYIEAAKSTQDPRLARLAAEVAVYAKDTGLGLKAARLWLKFEPDSPQVKQFYAALLVSENELAEAKTFIAKLLAEDAQNERRTAANLMQLPRLLSANKNEPGAFDLVRDLTAPYAHLPEAHYAIAQAGLRTGLTDKRIADISGNEIDRALAIRSGWEPGIILKAQIVSKNSPDQALQLLQSYLADHPKAKAPRGALAELLVDQKRYSEARDELVTLAKNDPEPDLEMAIARISLQMMDYAYAENVLQKMLGAGSSDPDMLRMSLGQISEQRKNYPQAIEYYQSVEQGEHWWNAQLRIGFATSEMGKLDEAIAYLHKLEPEDQEQRVQVIQAEAQFLRDAEKYQAAYDVLGDGLKTYPESPDLLYDIAMAAEKVDRLEVVESKLKQLIELKPDNAQAYNALGYTLVDRTKRSEEGLHYIEKAYSLAPADPFILDSMGWALYRTGKVNQSIDYLRKALAGRPDAEIAAHLGEVLWVEGQRAEAKRVWTSQLRETPDNTVLKETMRRFVP